ncbi:MAG: 2-oxo acid dehydrogenase subunit E2 [Clostridia bacterium]|nr:2-oxo acid dehydrogenase subunit E2 [Clostridia bacterium]
MATLVIMPRQGQSVESCVITEWAKKKGDKVAEGDVLFSYETDKSSFDETATVAGTLLEVFAEDGDDVPCLDPVCIIGEEGEDISALMPEKKAEEAPAAPAAEVKEEAPAAAPVAAVAATVSADGRMKISPRARHLAEQTDADLAQAVPTGPNGRIIERDVNALVDAGKLIGTAVAEAPAAVAAAPAAAAAEEVEYVDEKLPNIRKVIARAMHNSLSTMAQVTMMESFDATELLAYRAKCKANAEKLGLSNITINDMILFAVAKTALNHRDINANYLDAEEKMRFFTNVHLGIAVDTDRGLLVPTVQNANKLTLNELSVKSKELIGKVKDGTIAPDLLKGASVTVSNVGAMGVEYFTPVVNPPQTAIIGVGGITRRVKNVAGQDVFYDAIGLSLTFDHRALDGSPAARFLKELCANLENFNLLLSK